MEKDNGSSNEQQGLASQKEGQQPSEGIIHNNPESQLQTNTEPPTMTADGESRPKTGSEGSWASLDGDELVQLLVDMGFREDLAKIAVQQTKDVEEAANLILIMQENDGGKIAAPTKAKVKDMHYKMVRPGDPGNSRPHRHQNDPWQDGCAGGPRRAGSLQNGLEKNTRRCTQLGTDRPDEGRCQMRVRKRAYGSL